MLLYNVSYIEQSLWIVSDWDKVVFSDKMWPCFLVALYRRSLLKLHVIGLGVETSSNDCNNFREKINA